MKTTRSVKLVALTILVGVVAACSGPTNTSPGGAGSPGASSAVPTFSGPADTVSINAGGKAMDGFWADQFFVGGTTFTNTATIDMSKFTSNPPPAAVFNTERYGEMTYTIPNRSGPQIVTLYFAETYVTGVGQRVFDVAINGTTVLPNFDIYASAGGPNRAVAETIAATPDSSGNIAIKFTTRTQSPKINGITVDGAGSTPTPPPATPTPPPAAPPTNSADAKASAGCDKAPALKNGTITIESNGSRSYILRVPDNYDNRHPYRLIIAYHWGGGTADQVAEGTGATESPFYGLWDLANNSTIFVAPIGEGSGNATGWPNPGGQDLTFSDAMLAQVEAGLCIDTTRIFANGFSYGAAMSYEMACARPNVVRAVLLYSGSLLSGCDGGTTPVAFYASHGVSDSVLDISQGRALRDHFVQVNGVTPQNPPEPAVGSGTHICTTYTGGSPKYPVEWCAFDGDHNPTPHDSGQSTSWNPPQAWAFISQF
jgi:hypothetical protein